MPVKSGCVARAFSRLSLISLLLTGLCLAQAPAATPSTNKKEAHAPRSRAALHEVSETNSAGSTDDDADREHPREREEWFLKGRLYHGKPAPQMLLRAQRQREVLRLQTFRARQLREAARAINPTTSAPTIPVWTELGPSPMRSVTNPGDPQDYGFVTGRVTAVAVDQTDATGNTVYIGGAYGGVWKSTTAANPNVANVVWNPITDDQATLAVGAIAVGPDASSHNIVLVGTGEANSSSDSYYGLGILRSTDAGASWTLISSADNGLRRFQGLAFSKIVFKSDNPSIVVAATASASEGISVGAENPINDITSCANPTVTATCRGLYYSYDSGQTWSQVTMQDPSGAPDNGSASDVIYNPQQQKFYAWSRAHGLYTSTDGITFTRAADQGAGSSGLIAQPTSTINLTNCPSAVTTLSLSNCPIYRGQIAQVPGRDEMYVWFVDSGGKSGEPYPANGGIYQTKDGGKTWKTIQTATILSCGDGSGCDTQQGDYNLALIAVPNGASATDIYAGSINIYRCQINSNNPTCAANPFVNLTHVYGCTPAGSFSNVHPDQHSFDFLQSNPNVIYFGNDGGIYRTLASENGASVPTSCQGSAPQQPYYPFDNLNGTMGSMTQFVWFQQHPTDQFTLLGGTQDNGSPAIDSGSAGSNGLTWHSVLLGDGGWTDINPNNTNDWFTENPGFYIYHCAQGTSCSDAAANLIITAATVGGDSASFYPPFLLDPQNSSQLILGTCRVWRASISGSSPSTLSQKFDGSTSGPCDSASPSFVTALAAGGPKTASGSQVIYAGTVDGNVFVTTGAVTGQTFWSKASNNGGFSNPQGYPISGIAIDPSVAAGTTAYVTVMGFNTPHVFQTTNGGASWTDITGVNGSGGLPDSPADGAVVDPATGTIYVATDVGVFSTASPAGANTAWTEVGPATGPGTLPNVAVTRVAIFNPQGQPPRLRVSTYGRGIWEMVLPGSSLPDYTIAIGNPDIETFPGQPVTYLGTETALNGYNGNVTVTCNAGTGGATPDTCKGSAINGTTGAFTVTAGDATVQDFSFQIQGSDGTLVREVPVTLRVVDFSLGAPNPSSVPNLVHGDSQSVQLTLTAMGSFDQTVTIDCDPATLPAGMTCTAAPITIPSGGMSQATVTINTAVITAANTYNLAIRAISTIGGNSVTHTQTLPVTVTAQMGFALDASAYISQTLKAGQTLTANIALAPHDSPTSTVTLTCSAQGIAGPCAVTPSSIDLSVTPNNAPVPLVLSLPTAGGSAASHQITVTATDGTATSHATLPFSLTDFSLLIAQQPGNTFAGGTAGFAFQLTPLNGYNSQVTLSCDAGALGGSCTFNPASPALTPGVTTMVTGSLSVPSGTAMGPYTLAITAADSTFSGLSHSATSTTFNVQAAPDFAVSANSQTVLAAPNGTASLPFTITPQTGYSGMVTLSCDTSALGQPVPCTFAPSASVALASGQAATVTASFTIPTGQALNAYNVSLTAHDNNNHSHSASSSVQVQDFNFVLSSMSTSKAAGAAIDPIPITLSGMGGFSSTVQWTVSGCPQLATCTVTPNQSTSGQSTTLTITTTAPTVSSVRHSRGFLAFWLATPFGGFGFVFLKRRKLVTITTLLFLLGLAACGGGGGGGGGSSPPITHPGTPAGTYTIMVTGTSTNPAKMQTHNFTLTVQ